jgi:hypothetical protein
MSTGTIDADARTAIRPTHGGPDAPKPADGL